MKDLLCTAIEKKQRVRFVYHGKARIGEPQCVGISSTGKEIVRMFLREGGSRPEQLFEIRQMESLQLLEEIFTIPGPNYKRNDSAMVKIFCQL